MPREVGEEDISSALVGTLGLANNEPKKLDLRCAIGSNSEVDPGGEAKVIMLDMNR
jgi:hypothetical protein